MSSTRKTLYDCLKPELKEGLERNRERYSHSVRSIVASLESNSFYSDLKIHEINSIVSFTDVDEFSTWNSYDWKYGEKLFNELYSN